MTHNLQVSNFADAVKFLKKNGGTVRYRLPKNRISVKLVGLEKLDGYKGVFVKQVGDGSIIELFDKTPFPKEHSDVVCPHFLELKWANGCWYDCAWCYLNGTFRFRPNGKGPHLKDKKKILRHVKTFLRNVGEPYMLNSGELSDSLVYEGREFSLTKDIVPLFKQQYKHKLLILTKSTAIRPLIDSDSQKQVVVSFSLNAAQVSEKWEHKAPHPYQRIDAAKQAFDAGYEVRVRIDPMVPIKGWQEEYLELVDRIFESFMPERITLGSLRGLQSTINSCTDVSWVDYLDEHSNWGRKVGFEQRLEIYSTIMNYLKEEHCYDRIAFCKETVKLWKALGLDYRKIKCNCIL